MVVVHVTLSISKVVSLLTTIGKMTILPYCAGKRGSPPFLTAAKPTGHRTVRVVVVVVVVIWGTTLRS